MQICKTLERISAVICYYVLIDLTGALRVAFIKHPHCIDQMKICNCPRVLSGNYAIIKNLPKTIKLLRSSGLFGSACKASTTPLL